MPTNPQTDRDCIDHLLTCPGCGDLNGTTRFWCEACGTRLWPGSYELPHEDRFVVRSVTGYPISLEGRVASNTPATIWAVHDSAVAYKVVREFRRGTGGGAPRFGPYKTARECAMQLAAELNAEAERLEDTQTTKGSGE